MGMGGLLPPVVAEFKADVSDFTGKIGRLSGDLDKMATKGESVGARLKTGIGAAWSAIGGVMAGVGTAMIAEADKLESSHAKLETAIKNTGHEYDEYSGRINKTQHSM